MAKRKDESGIPGYSVNNKSYLTTDKAFYLQGFHTLIKDATKDDLYHAEQIGLNLVASYIKIQSELLHLKKLKIASTLSTTTVIYQVKTGVMVNGKLYITVQMIDEGDIWITYNYRYRVSGDDYLIEQGKKQSQVNLRRKYDWTSTEGRRYYNRRELKRRRQKEK